MTLNDHTKKVLEEFNKKFLLDLNRVFFGDPEELKKQGWEVGETELIINQNTKPEHIEAFISKALKERDEVIVGMIKHLLIGMWPNDKLMHGYDNGQKLISYSGEQILESVYRLLDFIQSDKEEL